jgi:hypothetical protein
MGMNAWDLDAVHMIESTTMGVSLSLVIVVHAELQLCVQKCTASHI